MKNKKEKVANEEEPKANELQIKTIKELYSETDYPKSRQWNDEELLLLSKLDAGTHIEALIKVKRATNGNGHNNVKGFDKIGYSMIYKLVWRDWEKLSSNAFAKDISFSEAVLAEYLKYKNALEFADKAVRESGQK